MDPSLFGPDVSGEKNIAFSNPIHPLGVPYSPPGVPGGLGNPWEPHGLGLHPFADVVVPAPGLGQVWSFFFRKKLGLRDEFIKNFGTEKWPQVTSISHCLLRSRSGIQIVRTFLQKLISPRWLLFRRLAKRLTGP